MNKEDNFITKYNFCYEIEKKQFVKINCDIINNFSVSHQCTLNSNGYIVFCNLESKNTFDLLGKILYYINESCSVNVKTYIIGVFKENIDEDKTYFKMREFLDKCEKAFKTDELIIKNLKTNKVKQITQEIGKKPVLSFGNSGGDSAMHNYCLSNDYESKAFMLIADDEEDDHANREKALNLKEQWEDAGYIVISMRDDFTTIYGDGVLKTDFIFE